MIAIQVQQILNVKNHALLTKDKKLLQGLYNKEERNGLWAYDQQLRQMNHLHQWANKQGIEFKKINSQIQINNINKNNDVYSVNLLVSTEYQYLYQTNGPNSEREVNSFRLGTYHNLDITKENNNWQIKKDWHLNPFLNSLYTGELKDEKIREKILQGQNRSDVDLAKNRKKAVEYVDKFSGAANLFEDGFKYNPDYKNYNHYGGDCANFVSQALYESGSFTKTNIWNYKNNNGTKAWVNAHAFNQYMLNSGRGSLINRGSYKEVLDSSYELLAGDYIAYQKGGEVKHVSIVTGFDSRGYTLINSHNSDRYRAPWDLGWNKEGVKFWLVRMHY